MERKMASFSWVPSLLFLLFMASTIPIFSNEAEEEMAPVVAAVNREFPMSMFNQTRRQLRSFQICALCTCCGGPRGLCLPSPCCYAITCNIPNRPFGFCSFLPKTCNCFGCHL